MEIQDIISKGALIYEFSIKWQLLITINKVTYYRSEQIPPIEKVICGYLYNNGTQCEGTELADALGFNVVNNLGGPKKRYKDEAEIEIFKKVLDIVFNEGLVRISPPLTDDEKKVVVPEIIELTPLGGKSYEENKLFYCYNSSIETYELGKIKTAVGYDSHFFPYGESLNIFAAITDERPISNKKIDVNCQISPSVDPMVEVINFQSCQFQQKNAIISTIESNKIKLPSFVEVNVKLFNLNGEYLPTIFYNGRYCEEATVLLNHSLNQDYRIETVRKGLLEKLLFGTNDKITWELIVPFIDLIDDSHELYFKSLLSNRVEWFDEELFQYIANNANANEWSKISNICDIDIIENHLLQYKDNIEWNTISRRVSDKYLFTHILDFDWNFTIISEERNETVLKKFLDKPENCKCNWDWDILAERLDINYILENFDRLENISLWDITIHHFNTAIPFILKFKLRRWNWKYISSKSDFCIEHLAELEDHIEPNIFLESVLKESEEWINFNYNKLVQFNKEKAENISIDFSANEYSWPLKTVQLLSDSELINWKSAYSFIYNTDRIIWDKALFEKYKSKISEEGLWRIAHKIEDCSIITNNPELNWNWEAISARSIFIENEEFVKSTKSHLSWEIVLSHLESSTIESYWDEFELATMLSSFNSQIVKDITDRLSPLFIIQHLDFDWDWGEISHKHALIEDVDFVRRSKDKLSWEIVLCHLKSSTIESYWDEFELAAMLTYFNQGIVSSITEILSPDFISSHIDSNWDWNVISNCKEIVLGPDFISNHLNKINWQFAINFIQDNELEENFQKWNLNSSEDPYLWNYLTTRLAWSYICQYLDLKWNWDYLISNVFSEKDFLDYHTLSQIDFGLSRFDDEIRSSYWSQISKALSYENFREIILEKDMYNWDYTYLYTNDAFDIDKDLVTYKEVINWQTFCESQKLDDYFSGKSFNSIFQSNVLFEKKIKRLLSNTRYNWDFLSLSKLVSLNRRSSILHSFINKWDWDYLSVHSSLFKKAHNLSHFANQINFRELSKRLDFDFKLDEIEKEIITKDWDWFEISSNPSFPLTMQFINQHLEFKWDWGALSTRKDIKITSKDIIALEDKEWDWHLISHRDDIEFTNEVTTILYEKGDVDWYTITTNNKFFPEIIILEKLQNKGYTVNWECISRNLIIDYSNIDLITQFKYDLNWEVLQKRKDFLPSGNLFEKFEDVLIWDNISERIDIDFSEELLLKYRSKWNWYKLFDNPLLAHQNFMRSFLLENMAYEFIKRFKEKEDGETVIKDYTDFEGNEVEEKVVAKKEKDVDVEIFHFTHLFNAVDIIKNRRIFSRNYAPPNMNDAAGSVVDNRSEAHRYARFYFRTHTPTQFYNECLGIDSASRVEKWRKDYHNKWESYSYTYYPSARQLGLPQCPFPVFFKFNLKEVLSKQVDNCYYSNGNMQMGNSQVFKITEDTTRINTKYLYYSIKDDYEKYKQYGQQEFLVKNYFDFSELKDYKIICYDDDQKDLLISMLGDDPVISRITVDYSIYNRSNKELSISENDNKVSISYDYADNAYLLVKSERIDEIEVLSEISKIKNDELKAIDKTIFKKPDFPVFVYFFNKEKEALHKLSNRNYEPCLIYTNQTATIEKPKELSEYTKSILQDFVALKNIGIELEVSLFKPETLYSHHGIGHTTRVLFGAFLICRNSESIDQDIAKRVYISSILHDIGKEYDREGSVHGEKSANIFKRNYADELTNDEQNEIYNAIKYHSIDDEKCPENIISSKVWQILKDADALDRLRFSSNFDESFLRSSIFITEKGKQIINIIRKVSKFNKNISWKDPYSEIKGIIQELKIEL